MKRVVLLLVFAILFSCRQGDVVEKPENLLSEDQMVNVLYDMAILQSMRSQLPQVMEKHNLDTRTYIFTKYKIDSLTFAQNHKYYASRMEQYEKIQDKVAERLVANKEALSPNPAKAPKAPKPVKP